MHLEKRAALPQKLEIVVDKNVVNSTITLK